MFKKLSFFILLVAMLVWQLPFVPSRAQTQNTQPYTYLSVVKKAPIVFTALATRWHQSVPQGTNAELLLRFRYGNAWSDWYETHQDLDGVQAVNPEYPVNFLPVNPTNTFQYKVILRSENPLVSPLIENIEFTYINAKEKIQGKTEGFTAKRTNESIIYENKTENPLISTSLLAQNTSADLPANGLKIISRAEWGADESLRIYKEVNTPAKLVDIPSDFQKKYANELKISKVITKDENGKTLTWPLQYAAKISKIIIHHTDTTKNLDNPMQAIRDIYYYHTISRGWGDIGYNYIIDPQGNIYEGRYGGDGVVGAHAGPGNVGSIGIAVLGDYQNNDVPTPVLKSLITLIKAKTTQYHIDPTGKSSFRGENFLNIMGHQDIMATSCPGTKLYAQLGFIAASAKNGFEPKIIDKFPNLPVNKQYDFSLTGTIPFPQFDPGSKQTITIHVKNNGPGVWGVGTYFVLNRDHNAETFFIMNGVTKSIPLQHDIKPGEVADFAITLRSNYESGFAAIEFVPLINGITRVEKYINLPIQVKQPQYDFELVDINVLKPFLKKGVLTQATIAIKNTGNITWHRSGNSKFALGTDNIRDHINKLLLKPGARLGDLIEEEVAPGNIGHIKISLKAPSSEGLYKEYFTPLLEGFHWFPNKNTFFSLYVYAKEYSAQFIDIMADRNILPGAQKKLWIKIQNVGGVTWTKQGNQQLDFDLRNQGKLIITDFKLEEDQIKPGETAKISFTVQAPLKEGIYPLWIAPKINKNTLLKPINMGLRVQKESSSQEVIRPVTPLPGNGGNSTSRPGLTTNLSPIRIDLSFNENPVISADGSFALQNGEEDRATFSKNQKVSISYDQGSYTISTGQNSFVVNTPPRFYPTNGGILRIDNWNRMSSSSSPVKLNEFRGILEVRWYDNDLHVINELPMEDYLKGTGETNEQEPAEKLKAVMVLARSYATYYTKVGRKFPGAPFDLSDDPATSQKYIGYSAEKRSPNTVKAINDTTGIVVTYQGKIIKTPYFHSDDGRTRSAEEVWGWKDTPYLISVPDPYCKGQTLQGHGVGLSGCGSLGMAKAGKTFSEIIKYYFQGVQVGKL